MPIHVDFWLGNVDFRFWLAFEAKVESRFSLQKPCVHDEIQIPPPPF